jgi:UDPglucose 6-dehydrogenase/GDP-mannose 6-dehydrogenase
MDVSIIGTGYVGLVTGACLADAGHRVVCVDLSAERVASVNAGVAPFVEPGLDELLARTAGRSLTATSDLRAAVLATDLTLIAVGTPFDGHRIDLSYVETVAGQIGDALRDKDSYHVVVTKSTVVPGTTETLVRSTVEKHSDKRAGEDFGLGMNPEFLSEGEAVNDFMRPDRVVLGGIDERSLDAQAALYAHLVDVPIMRTNPATAEMIKYAANAVQATLISFSNEMANLCATMPGVDVVDVLHGVHLSRLFQPLDADGKPLRAAITSFLGAGAGFGGSCFPKDLAALAAFGDQFGTPMRLTESVLAVNDAQPAHVVALVRERLGSLSGEQIAVLGLAFKPGTDDMRHSPALAVIAALRAEGAVVRGYDPVATDAARRVLGDDIRYCADLTEAVDGVAAVVLVTAWPQFRELAAVLRGRVEQPLVVDGRRILDPTAFARYEGVGRAPTGLTVTTDVRQGA